MRWSVIKDFVRLIGVSDHVFKLFVGLTDDDGDRDGRDFAQFTDNLKGIIYLELKLTMAMFSQGVKSYFKFIRLRFLTYYQSFKISL